MSILTEYDEIKEKKKIENSMRKYVREETLKESKELAVEILMENFSLSLEDAQNMVEKKYQDAESHKDN